MPLILFAGQNNFSVAAKFPLFFGRLHPAGNQFSPVAVVLLLLRVGLLALQRQSFPQGHYDCWGDSISGWIFFLLLQFICPVREHGEPYAGGRGGR